MTVELIIAVALSSAIIVIVLALVGIIVFQRWRISDKNAALGKFIRENAELRQKIQRAGVLSLVLLFTCCGDTNDDNKKIDIEVSIGMFKPDNIPFVTGDKMTLYAWTGSASSVTADAAAQGVEYTYGSDMNWSTNSPMLWTDKDHPYYFLCFYPARDVTDFSADPYTLNTADQKASNLLVARNLKGTMPTSDPVSLQFDHAMALVVVNLLFRSQWEGTPTVSSVTARAAGSCTIDYLNQTYNLGEQTDIVLPATEIAQGYALSYQSIMIPQRIHSLVIVIAGQAYTFTHAEGIPLTAGKYTTLNLTVGRDDIELGAVNINDWVPGDVIDGNSSMGN